MTYRVEFSRRARRQLEDLIRTGPANFRAQIARALNQLETNPYPNPDLSAGTIKPINDFWRYKVTYRYRMIYRTEGSKVLILAIAHRKDIYRIL